MSVCVGRTPEADTAIELKFEFYTCEGALVMIWMPAAFYPCDQTGHVPVICIFMRTSRFYKQPFQNVKAQSAPLWTRLEPFLSSPLQQDTVWTLSLRFFQDLIQNIKYLIPRVGKTHIPLEP
ncbi:hypothetical protein STEG23_001155 [Scotinomys teguina]